jgi:hypothetical protein
MSRLVALALLLTASHAPNSAARLAAQDRRERLGPVALTLIQDPGVQSELALDSEQVEHAMHLRDQILSQLRTRATQSSFTAARSPAEDVFSNREQAIQINDLSLTQTQKRRLREIELQYMRTRGLASYLLSNSELAVELGISDSQRDQLRQIVEVEVRTARSAHQSRLLSRGDAVRPHNVGASQEKKVLQLLDEQQISTLNRLEGDPVRSNLWPDR